MQFVSYTQFLLSMPSRCMNDCTAARLAGTPSSLSARDTSSTSAIACVFWLVVVGPRNGATVHSCHTEYSSVAVVESIEQVTQHYLIKQTITATRRSSSNTCAPFFSSNW